ncbi:hypothetical protein Tco_0900955 [Tanacetum coccineum]
MKVEKKSSDEESLTSDREDEEYAMAIRLSTFFKRLEVINNQDDERNLSIKKERCKNSKTKKNALDVEMQIASSRIPKPPKAKPKAFVEEHGAKVGKIMKKD